MANPRNAVNKTSFKLSSNRLPIFTLNVSVTDSGFDSFCLLIIKSLITSFLIISANILGYFHIFLFIFIIININNNYALYTSPVRNLS